MDARATRRLLLLSAVLLLGAASAKAAPATTRLQGPGWLAGFRAGMLVELKNRLTGETLVIPGSAGGTATGVRRSRELVTATVGARTAPRLSGRGGRVQAVWPGGERLSQTATAEGNALVIRQTAAVGAAPLVAAGLQLYWTQLVRATGAALDNPFGFTQDATRCPCCGSLPTASVTRVGGERDGFRYLHCALCNAEWHMVRVKCAHCLGTGGIRFRALQAIDDAQPQPQRQRREAVQAETCDTCHHYLKIVHMDKELQVEPIADDLASLTLDLLVSEEGYQRHGVNYMLLFGDAEADGDHAGSHPEGRT